MRVVTNTGPIRLTIGAPPDDGRVLIGHDVSTGAPVYYVARTRERACNGLISGATGTGKSALADRVVEHLRGTWTVRVVDASDPAAADHALDALFAAERAQSRRHQHDPFHLVVWDGLDQLVRDDRLRFATFAERLAASAADGPAFGIGHLAVVQSGRPDAFRHWPAVRNLLADNVIALRDSGRDALQIGAAVAVPSALPRRGGHALVSTGGAAFVHVRLDGAR